MSQVYLEKEFPLAQHPRARFIRECVQRSVRGENANPLADDWSDDAHIFLRVDHVSLFHELRQANIDLDSKESIAVHDFADEYAELREGETE